jgi:predicted Zn-dependent protease
MARLPSRIRIAHLAAALLIATAALPLRAQKAEPPAPVPPEFSEAARKAYGQALKEARTLVADKQYDLAINRLDALAAERPREPQARFLKATILTDQGKDDEAIAQLVALTADFPELPEPHNNLAVLYGKKGQYDLARRELETAIAAAPDYAIGHENLGDVYARLAATQYELTTQLDKRGKSAPLKLKLVRDVLAMNAPPPAAITPAAPAVPATPAAKPEPAVPAPAPAAATTDTNNAAPTVPAATPKP